MVSSPTGFYPYFPRLSRHCVLPVLLACFCIGARANRRNEGLAILFELAGTNAVDLGERIERARLSFGHFAQAGVGEDHVWRDILRVGELLAQCQPLTEQRPVQIGRAPGRERVCQSVWISVVAESLKKKK